VSGPEAAYLIFGLTLCALLVAAIAFYFSRKRRERVEEAKFKMLEDDEDH
jgi:LPXTG-motif cell wall-anchored protein